MQDGVTAIGHHVDSRFSGRLRAEFPSQVIVDVTENCNLKCAHCASAAFRRSALHSGSMLSVELNSKLCEEVAQFGQGITQYLRYAASGEPLLHPDIERMLADAVRTSGTLVTLTTNGTLLSDVRIEGLLATGLHMIDISIDAMTPETYSRVRVNGSLPETQANVLRLLRARAEMGSKLVVVVSFIEQALNAHEATGFEAYWREQGVDHVVIRRLHSNAGANDSVAKSMRAENAGRDRTPCPYPWERLVLNSRGKLGFCPADWTHKASIADYRSSTVRGIWEGPFLQGLRKAHCDDDFLNPQYSLCAACPDWVATRWPDEGRSYADMVSELGQADGG